MIQSNGGLTLFGAELREEASLVVMDGKGGSVVPSINIVRPGGELAEVQIQAELPAVMVSGKMRWIFMRAFPLVEEIPYNICGYVYPVGSRVGLIEGDLTVVFDRLDESRLEDYVDNPDRKTMSAEDGYFQFNDIHELPAVTLVLEVPVKDVKPSEVENCGISAWANPELDSDMQVQSLHLLPPSDGEYVSTEFKLDIEGTVPDGVKYIYYSRDKIATFEDLSRPLNSVYEPEPDGTFSISGVHAGENATGNVAIISDTREGFTAEIVKATFYSCLSGDTPITMADGTTRRLDTLEVGDLVRAGDGSAVRVLRTARGHFNPYHTLYAFADGAVINETHEHRFFNCEQGFYQLLGRWKIGEHALRQDGERVALVRVERIEEPGEMCGLWTESHDYFASGLLSGETGANQRFLADATAEQAAEMAASLNELALLRLLGLEGIMP